MINVLVKTITISIVSLLILVLSFACSENDNPARPQVSQEYEFAAEALDIFFLFRDRLPDNYYSFSSPEALYESVNENWTEYFGPHIAKQFALLLTTQTAGVGIRTDSTGAGYVIKDVIVNSPGAAAGLRKGDTLTKIDDISAVGLIWDILSAKLEGTIGSKVTLGIKRGTDTLSLIVTRGIFDAPTVFVDSVGSSIAVITLTGILSQTNTTGGSVQEFRNALSSTTWAKHLVLDLRGNPGGELDQCVEIVSELVPPGTPIVAFHERDYDPNTNRGVFLDTVWHTISGGGSASKDLTILADRNTASAAEILISCITTARPSVLLMGDTTYGKGRAQVLFWSPDSGICKITYATLKPPNGSSYDQIGIVPSIETGKTADALVAAKQRIEGVVLTKATALLPGHKPHNDFKSAQRPPLAFIVRKGHW
jgi:C-terminal peptidase prc